jgi:hypothetical protein|tara:strand:- start:231 stop:680 length:450 start_codon:yes stop_codon:yes gene_type:complete
MSSIDIRDLHRKTNELKNRKVKIYDEVLQKCHHRIKLVSKLTPLNQWCFYIIPKVLFGIPLYNLAECVEYLVKLLSENGFRVAYTHPNLLLITWFESNTDVKKSTYTSNTSNNNSNQNTYKSIDTYRPSGSLVYNQQNFNLLEQKRNRF